MELVLLKVGLVLHDSEFGYYAAHHGLFCGSQAMSFYAIVGYGGTGQAYERWCQRQALPYRIFDDNSELQQVYPLEHEHLAKAERILLSPGVDPAHPTLRGLQHLLANDLGLFISSFDDIDESLPLALITGSNGKSTVTSMLGHILQCCGWRVGVGGNLGEPMLDLLEQDYDFYVLELSSFQLELNDGLNLRARLAALLNISPDHLDRHHSLANYARIKRIIFQGCHNALYNHDQKLCAPIKHIGESYSFSALAQDTWACSDGAKWQVGEEAVTPPQLSTFSQCNYLNAMVAASCASLLGVDLHQATAALTSYQGLAHRSQLVRKLRGVSYVNDSKATNLAATRASLVGLGAATASKILLIAGGRAKGEQQYAEIVPELQQYVRAVATIGEQAEAMCASWGGAVECHVARELPAAVNWCAQKAQSGDIVLLAPACASFDQFANFGARGEAFAELVGEL